MDQKAWLAKKRFSGKSNAVKSEAEIPVEGNEQEAASLLCERNAKTAKEANIGMERNKTETGIQKEVANERLVHLSAALKNCRHQLSYLKIEQNQRVNLERAHKRLESKYTEARNKLANLTVENARLTKALVKKEKIIKDVSNQMSEATVEFNNLISRLDSTERGNNVLKYEYHILERELKMRNRRADVANKLHREKLDAERHKLRLLMRKRIRRHTKNNPSNHPKAVEKRMSSMVKRLCEVEEENKILKENAIKRENEICLLKAELSRNIDHCSDKNNLHLVEAKLLESENRIVSLKTKIEHLTDSTTTDDNFDNLKLINVDLDHQLSAAKVEIKEALQKICFLEMELEDKSHHCEGLETACLELQLQLSSFSSKDEATEDLDDHDENQIQTGLEITAELTNNKKLSPRSSLRDHMAAEDLISSSMIREIINTTETNGLSSVPCHNSYGVKNVVHRALPIVPSKKRGQGSGLLWKLLFRRKRGSSKKKLFAFATYHADLVRVKDGL